jgi:hypothetical protein
MYDDPTIETYEDGRVVLWTWEGAAQRVSDYKRDRRSQS